MGSATFVIALALTLAPPSDPIAGELSEEALDALVQPLIDGFWMPGLVVGVLADGERTVRGYGRYSWNDERVPDGATMYEIGSVSKVLTGLLLADALEWADIELDDPVGETLEGVSLPEWDGVPITWLDLATHTSGLPRLPDNLDKTNWRDPYSGYSEAQLYDALENLELSRRPGSGYEYSNLGYGLLGHALSRGYGIGFDRLLRLRLSRPMGIRDTLVRLGDSQRERLAPGHGAQGRPTPNWDLGVLAGAGGMRSNVDDLLTLLEQHLDEDGPFEDMTRAVLKPRRRAYSDDSMVALGWNVITDLGLWWHNGETGGYHAFIALDPEDGLGVVVLTNQATALVDKVGLRIMTGLRGGQVEPLELDAVAPVSRDVLDRYVGEYQLEPDAVLTVTRQGDLLHAQLTGQSTYPVFAEDERSFRYRVVEARLTFETAGDGPAEAVVLDQNGRQYYAPRCDG